MLDVASYSVPVLLQNLFQLFIESVQLPLTHLSVQNVESQLVIELMLHDSCFKAAHLLYILFLVLIEEIQVNLFISVNFRFNERKRTTPLPRRSNFCRINRRDARVQINFVIIDGQGVGIVMVSFVIDIEVLLEHSERLASPSDLVGREAEQSIVLCSEFEAWDVPPIQLLIVVDYQ